MFNLKESIAQWHRQMLAAGIKSPAPLEELETHLRDEIERQTILGRSEAEAFASAVQKIGTAQMIQNEFARADEEEEERKFKEGRIWFLVIFGSISLISGGFVLFNSEMTLGQRISGFAAVAMIGLLAGVGRVSYRVFPIIRVRRVRLAITLVSTSALAMIWAWMFARYFLPGQESPFGQYLAALLWAACWPLGGSAGLCWGIETAARKKAALPVLLAS